MPKVSFDSLAVVLSVAFLVPLLLGFVPKLRVPAVVVEIVAGIVVGPQVLDWAQADEPVQILALVGLAFLLFLAGLEIDTSQLKGQLLRVASVGFGVRYAASKNFTFKADFVMVTDAGPLGTQARGDRRAHASVMIGF